MPMKELAAVLEDSGLARVQTYIQSGNVVFQSKTKNAQQLAGEIGTAISHSHEFKPQVFVLSIQELRDAIDANPFPDGEGEPKSLHLIFLKSLPTSLDVQRLESLQSESERFKLSETVFYLHAPDGIGRSKLAANVEKILGVASTARNWRTASTILSMAEELAS